jgi:hypothetical protein
MFTVVAYVIIPKQKGKSGTVVLQEVGSLDLRPLAGDAVPGDGEP